MTFIHLKSLVNETYIVHSVEKPLRIDIYLFIYQTEIFGPILPRLSDRSVNFSNDPALHCLNTGVRGATVGMLEEDNGVLSSVE